MKKKQNRTLGDLFIFIFSIFFMTLILGGCATIIAYSWILAVIKQIPQWLAIVLTIINCVPMATIFAYLAGDE